MTVEEVNLSDLSTATYQAAINNIQGFLKYLQTNDECGLAETREALYLSTESRMKRLHRSGKNRVVEEVAVVDIGIFSSLVLPCDGIDLDWVFEELIPYLSTGQEVELSTAEIIVACAHDRFSCEPLLVDMNFSMEDDDLILVGDIHGQFRDLLQIFEHYGRPSERRRYLFNGDIVDRGPRSMACWLLLCAMKVAAPDRIFVTRGNHESKTVSVLTSSFAVECVHMYSEDCFDACHRVFDQLPVAYIINSSIFVTHGGLPDSIDLDSLRTLSKSCPFDAAAGRTIMALLWNDPGPRTGYYANSRGLSTRTFGPDITENFLNQHRLSLLIRSHEYKVFGFEFTHNHKVLTIFSCPDYQGLGNSGAVVRIDRQNSIDIKQFY